MAEHSTGTGTAADPWTLRTPPLSSEFTMYVDDQVDPPLLVCQVGGTRLQYLARAIDDLHAELVRHGDWMPLGAADEQKPAAPGTVEAWGRSPTTRSAAGTARRRASEVGSECTCRPCSRRSAWSSWSTTPATTGSAPPRPE